MRATILLIGGILIALAGTVWILQGLNVIPVGFMAGDRTWVVLGAVAVAVGAGVSWLGWSRRRQDGPPA